MSVNSGTLTIIDSNGSSSSYHPTSVLPNCTITVHPDRIHTTMQPFGDIYITETFYSSGRKVRNYSTGSSHEELCSQGEYLAERAKNLQTVKDLNTPAPSYNQSSSGNLYYYYGEYHSIPRLLSD